MSRSEDDPVPLGIVLSLDEAFRRFCLRRGEHTWMVRALCDHCGDGAREHCGEQQFGQHALADSVSQNPTGVSGPILVVFGDGRVGILAESPL